MVTRTCQEDHRIACSSGEDIVLERGCKYRLTRLKGFVAIYLSDTEVCLVGVGDLKGVINLSG